MNAPDHHPNCIKNTAMNTEYAIYGRPGCTCEADFPFCRHCGAGMGSNRRVGEGTCPKCDPVGCAENAENQT